MRSWIKRLEREASPLHDTIRLPDGKEIRHERGEMFGALLAAIHGQEHRLLPYLRQIDTNEGMPGLIRALEAGETRAS